MAPRCPTCHRRLDHRWSKEGELVSRAAAVELAAIVRQCAATLRVTLKAARSAVEGAAHEIALDVARGVEALAFASGGAPSAGPGHSHTVQRTPSGDELAAVLERVEFHARALRVDTDATLRALTQSCRAAAATPSSDAAAAARILSDALPRVAHLPFKNRDTVSLQRLIAWRSAALMRDSATEAVRLAAQCVREDNCHSGGAQERAAGLERLLAAASREAATGTQLWGAELGSRSRTLWATALHRRSRFEMKTPLTIADATRAVAEAVGEMSAMRGGGGRDGDERNEEEARALVEELEEILSDESEKAAVAVSGAALRVTNAARQLASDALSGAAFATPQLHRAASAVARIDDALRGAGDTGSAAMHRPPTELVEWSPPALLSRSLTHSPALIPPTRSKASAQRAAASRLLSLSPQPSLAPLRSPPLPSPQKRPTSDAAASATSTSATSSGTQVDMHGPFLRRELRAFIDAAAVALHRDFLGDSVGPLSEVELVRRLPHVAAALSSRVGELHDACAALGGMLNDKQEAQLHPSRHPRPLALARLGSQQRAAAARASGGGLIGQRVDQAHLVASVAESVGAPFHR